MIFIDQILPEGALLGDTSPSLSNAMRDTGALWVCAESALADSVENPTSLQARTGNGVAIPTNANEGGCPHDTSEPIAALHFEGERHRGLVVEGAVMNAAEFTVAVIFKPLKHATKTLMTIHQHNGGDYIFLSEDSGEVLCKNRKSTVEVTLNAGLRHGEYNLCVVGYSSGRLSIRLNDGQVLVSDESTTDFDGGADLFIGCRSHRPGILKTLGDSKIADVFVWQGEDHLQNTLRGGPLALVQGYWNGVINHGI